MSENLTNNENSILEYPFDRMESATPVSSIEVIEGTISEGEEKWYKFTTSAPNAHVNGNKGEYEFYYAPGLTVTATLFDSNGTELAYYDSVTVYDFRVELPANESFYIRVSPTGPESGDFRVHGYVVDQQQMLTSGFASATLMSVWSGEVSEESSLRGRYDRRWFKIHAAGMRGHLNGEPNEYYISVTCNTPTVTILYDETGKEIGRNYNGTTYAEKTLTCMLESGAYYYASVYSPENSTAAFEITADYKIMPNLGSSIEAAIKLTNGQNYEEVFSSYNEDKWFKFTATAHEGDIGGYTFSGLFDRDFAIVLFDSNGNVIQPVNTVIHSRDFCFWCTMATNATYYLRVTSMSEDGGSFYVQAVETPSVLNSGSSMSDAITIYNIYTPVEGAITVPGEAKWYKLTVDGHYDKIIVHSLGDSARIAGELFDSDGNLITSDNLCPEEGETVTPYNFRISHSCLAGYSFYLRVTARGNDTGTFRVRWTDERFIEHIFFREAVVKIPEGEYETIAPVLEPADTTDTWIEWSSSDESVATVSQNGEIRAKRAGTAVITATAGSYPPVSKSVFVRVFVPTERVLMPEEVTLDIGQTYTFATFPENATSENITWEVDDPDGVIDFNPVTRTVTALKPGIATITAKPEHGSTSKCSIEISYCGGANYKDVTEHTMVLQNDGYFVCSKCGYRVKSPELQDKDVLSADDYLKIVCCDLHCAHIENLMRIDESLANLSECQEIAKQMIAEIRQQENYAKKYEYSDGDGKCVGPEINYDTGNSIISMGSPHLSDIVKLNSLVETIHDFVVGYFCPSYGIVKEVLDLITEPVSPLTYCKLLSDVFNLNEIEACLSMAESAINFVNSDIDRNDKIIAIGTKRLVNAKYVFSPSGELKKVIYNI